jgi:hypothetical protein
LGIGTSSPVSKIDARSGSATMGNYQTIQAFSTDTSAAVDLGGGISLGGFYTSTLIAQFGSIVGRKENSTSGNYAGYLAFGTNSQATGVAEHARINSSGQLLINRTTDSASAGGSLLQVTGTPATWVTYFENTNSTGSNCYGMLCKYINASPNNTGNEFIYFADSTAARMTVRSNGGIGNYQGNDVNFSDRREKTNFSPSKPYLDVICAIPVQTFNFIDQNHEEDGGLTLGVVAQDVQAVAPELVTESNWGTEEEPKMRLSIYQTDLQYALMKSIQEQQTIITQLTARITALESA